jgi:uncharacterized repeat protein (TIGR03803 family)
MKRRYYAVALIALALFALGTQPVAAAAQEEVVYGFAGSPDGSTPYDGLIADAAGNLYGTTSSGGSVDAPEGVDGTVFELRPAAGGTWTETVIYNFGATSADGITPFAGLVFDAQGNLYGTTSLGGAHGFGTVFELSPGAGGVWTEKVLYSFGATSTDASQPKRGSLIFDASGNLYGTTRFGGPNSVTNGGGLSTGGTVFELSPAAGGEWTEQVLYSFGATSTDGANPVDGLLFDTNGNLYGTTLYGGTYNYGTVFELSPAAGGSWTEKILHSFNLNGIDGTLPYASLIQDAAGNLYGTATGGGVNDYSGGLGAVFELTPAAGGEWTEQVLHSFNAIVTDGDYPYGRLVLDGAGNLYGTCSSRLFGYGNIFELTPAAGGTWTETVLYNFGGNPDGQAPLSGLIFDAAGYVYGTTSTGGPNGLGLAGVVFKFGPVTTATPTFSPGAGTYGGAQNVTITDATAGATIYYTTNGTTPTSASAIYSGAISVNASETLKAVAVGGGLPISAVGAAIYKINPGLVYPTSLSFGDQAVGTPSAARKITVTNIGVVPLTVSSVTLIGANVPSFSTSNTCGSPIAVSGTCTISVTFTPRATGAKSAIVSMVSNAAGSPTSVMLAGTGISAAPAISVMPPSVPFGSQTIGVPSTAQHLTVTNTGTAALSISSVTLAGANVPSFSSGNTCGSPVAASGTCTISATFTPRSTGAKSASLSIVSNAASSPTSVPLTGTGISAAPAISVMPPSIPFGSQTIDVPSAAQNITVTNTGTAPLNISSVTLTGANVPSFSIGNTCGSPIAISGTCTVAVTFTPRATGAKSANVSIVSNAAGSPTIVALTGTGS